MNLLLYNHSCLYQLGEEETVIKCGMCRVPRKVADTPSLETFKARLDRAPSNLIQLKMLDELHGVRLDEL